MCIFSEYHIFRDFEKIKIKSGINKFPQRGFYRILDMLLCEKFASLLYQNQLSSKFFLGSPFFELRM